MLPKDLYESESPLPRDLGRRTGAGPAASSAFLAWRVRLQLHRHYQRDDGGLAAAACTPLAALAAFPLAVARAFTDQCLEQHAAGALDSSTASMAKYWCTDLQGKVADECVQLHGGWGYMWEYPVCRNFVDARVQRIYGGSNEIMKELIARQI